MTDDEPKPRVDVRIPGNQNFTRTQREALQELRDEIDARGFETKFPIVRTSSVTLQTLETVGIYIASGYYPARAGKRLLDKLSDDLVDAGYSWAKRIFTHERGDEPHKTEVTIYGPDKKPLKRIEVENLEDDDS